MVGKSPFGELAGIRGTVIIPAEFYSAGNFEFSVYGILLKQKMKDALKATKTDAVGNKVQPRTHTTVADIIAENTDFRKHQRRHAYNVLRCGPGPEPIREFPWSADDY